MGQSKSSVKQEKIQVVQRIKRTQVSWIESKRMCIACAGLSVLFPNQFFQIILMYGGLLLTTWMTKKPTNPTQNCLQQPNSINDDKISNIEKIYLKELERCQQLPAEQQMNVPKDQSEFSWFKIKKSRETSMKSNPLITANEPESIEEFQAKKDVSNYNNSSKLQLQNQEELFFDQNSIQKDLHPLLKFSQSSHSRQITQAETSREQELKREISENLARIKSLQQEAINLQLEFDECLKQQTEQKKLKKVQKIEAKLAEIKQNLIKALAYTQKLQIQLDQSQINSPIPVDNDFLRLLQPVRFAIV